uniref:SFRICE_015771 n=1 Tax=Spodoptera frugiperda TaxID=7108 RepID=A0A2H1V5K4_SPOFR
MKLEISDSQSNQSDISCDSQSSQDSSTNDFVSSVPTSRSLLTNFSEVTVLWQYFQNFHKLLTGITSFDVT